MVGKADFGRNDAEGHEAELARANLLRLRGDLKGAIAACLAILRQVPEHHGAHSFLGDLHTEAGSLEEAAEWYELALDLDPDAEADRRKLTELRTLIERRDAEQAVAGLGLPPDTDSTPLLAGGLLALVAVAGLIGFLVLRGRPVSRPTPPLAISAPLQEPIVAAPEPAPVPPAVAGSVEDAALAVVRGRSSEGARITQVLRDPRAGSMTVVFTLRPGEVERRVAATIGRDTLGAVPDVPVVTVRAIRNTEVVYIADCPRARLIETEAQGWAEAHGGPEAWMSHLLTNEWPPPVPSSPPAPSTPAPAENPTPPTETNGGVVGDPSLSRP